MLFKNFWISYVSVGYVILDVIGFFLGRISFIFISNSFIIVKCGIFKCKIVYIILRVGIGLEGCKNYICYMLWCKDIFIYDSGFIIGR